MRFSLSTHPAVLKLLGLIGLLCMLCGVSAHAADLSDETKACLKCHDKPGLQMKTQAGEPLPLHVSTQDFVASMHKDTDCEDCHDSLDMDTHGKTKSVVKSKRAFSASMKDGCASCHKKRAKEYDDGIHATMIKEGNDKAPLCSDCHNSHTLKSVKLATPLDQTPCAACHKEIFKAYAKDVHGLERVAKGKTSPLCADCHQSHAVKAASLGDHAKGTCLSCHKEAVKQHKDWLPNTDLHFQAISCPACHSPTAQRRVNLRLYDQTGQKQLIEKSGVPRFAERAKAADAENDGLDQRALWSMLQQFSQDQGGSKTIVRGRLEVTSGAAAHQLTEKEHAIKDCKTCHQAGAEAFQTVVLTIAGPDGRPIRHGVQQGVLNSLMVMNSVKGFYAIGSTRIKLLDYLLVLVVLGALGGVLAHFSIRRAMKGYRERRLAALHSAAASTTVGTDTR